MSDAPPWRRLDPRSAPARLAAFALLAALAAATAAAALGPLVARRAAAEGRLAATIARAEALERAAVEIGAQDQAPASEAVAAAQAWLVSAAPTRAGDAATLALLSGLRATAEERGVTLTALAPVRAEAAELQALAPPLGLGLSLVAAEARIVADHAGLAAFLEALERAPDGARVVALDVAAASAAPLAEAGRLTARVLAVALVRAPGG